MNTRHLLSAFALLFVVGFTFGQKDSERKVWKQLESSNGIEVDYRKGECNQPKLASYTEEVYLKFTNTTDQVVMVTWMYDATYGDKCWNCDGTNEEMIQTVKVSPNSSKEGECGDKNEMRLRIFSKFTNMENPQPLNDFHVTILSVEPEID